MRTIVYQINTGWWLQTVISTWKLKTCSEQSFLRSWNKENNICFLLKAKKTLNKELYLFLKTRRINALSSDNLCSLTSVSALIQHACSEETECFLLKIWKNLAYGGGTDKQPNCECKPNESKKAFIEQGGIKPNHILSSRIQQIGKNLLPYQRYWLLTERIDYKSIPYERKHAFTKDTPKYILF